MGVVLLGQPKVVVNLYFEEFVKSLSRGSTNADWCEPELRTSRAKPAVEIL
jgi:hypothetical protein